MRFVCHEHGEVETVNVNGYSLGHRTGPNAPDEHDLNGIDFVFGTDDGEVVIEDADGAEDYLSKFADWREKLIEAITQPGIPETRNCPNCGDPTWCLEADEPVSEP